MIDNDKVVGHLNSFLRGELSAAETYRQAISRVEDAPTRVTLEEAHRSHAQRVQALRDRIRELGGQPAESSGAWGMFAKLVEGGAKAFGAKAAVAALEEGEDHGLKDYQKDLGELDLQSRQLVEQTLLPAQQQTHATLSRLKHTLH